ncbi:MAG: hypothetical protein QOE05_119 [Actinomycetota bacterium]|jgi:hypothetical protein|nr:hypothetical protein [Actinomycetota bacterium]
MRARRAVRSLLLPALVAASLVALPVAESAADPYAGPTPGSSCVAGSLPETMQGRAPAEDVATGRAAKGYTCNAVQIGYSGSSGGYRVERYVDPAGHECAFHDSDTFFGEQAAFVGPDSTGVYVVDMHDPRHPVRTEVLRTPAMQSPHEGLRLNAKRGLLVAAFSTISTGPGDVEVYDVSKDCRHPTLLSSTPLGLLGHEGAFAPDGRTYYVTSLNAHSLAAVNLDDPTAPSLEWFIFDYGAHGASVSLDGKRLYVAESGGNNGFSGLTILDVSQVQDRVPFPTVPVVSRLTWPQVSIPQNATPFTRDGHPYVLETDEFGERITGAARIIDIADEKHPFVASNLRLQVNQPEVYDELQNDPGNGATGRGYQAHYCTVPSRVDPNIVACSFIMSGLRVFDIRNPAQPREVAYFNKPALTGERLNVGAFGMSAPAYDPASRDIWYADGNLGLYVVHLVGPAGIPFARSVVSPGS